MVKQETVNDAVLLVPRRQARPVRVLRTRAVEDNCLSCHNPHGSSHNFLLNEKVPNLCQDCHDWSRHPGTIYGGTGGWTIHRKTVGGAATPTARRQPGASTRASTLASSRAPA